MNIQKLRNIAREMGAPKIKKAIKIEINKLRTAGKNDIADAVDEVLRLC
tara:strand:+ start:298 stop:444 length:147 start_codon:yes stop_codon:yes gene_type:complete